MVEEKSAAQLKLRVPGNVRDALEKAARENGRTLNAEVLARLQASLAPEASERTKPFMDLAAAAILAVEQVAGEDWRSDFGTWRAAADAVNWALKVFRPNIEDAAEFELALSRRAAWVRALELTEPEEPKSALLLSKGLDRLLQEAGHRAEDTAREMGLKKSSRAQGKAVEKAERSASDA